ncbi:response regulator [Marispirochaeta sp.]|jgi:two-component system, OmpR family, alkaline phosphatase synthesis response regulator PhoP|uniref:response regulator n=1 Tax=Marispirochaeta sp. TaxID=2038653 RepID=UPI0029C94DA1|nr:response regulator [Marispirochaeta sp.]
MDTITILVVEDEDTIFELIRFNLEKEGFKVHGVSRGNEVLKELARIKPDLLVLDLMLPGANGIDICRYLRSQESTRALPILMVTAKNEDSDIVLGLEIGADDYLTKPFSPRVLVARVRALLRRGQDTGDSEVLKEGKLTIHDISIDPRRHLVERGGEVVDLSLTEYQILHFLAGNPGWVYSRNQIISNIKGDDYPVTERSVDVQVLNIRKKLKESGAFIETVRGIGYRMKEES